MLRGFWRTPARALARAGLLAALAGTPVHAAAAAGALQPGDGTAAPALVLNDLDGNSYRLDALRGRTVLVNFWATWCAPCVVEMPSLGRLRDALAVEGFEVLAVNVQENAARIRPFVDRLGLGFPVLRDHDGSARAAWDVRVFPSTFVIDPRGRVALVAIGEIDWDDARIVARVREVMRGPGAVPAGTRAGLDARRKEP
jgi:peroxiredoxin